MHRHEVTFRVEAPPHRVWRLLHPKTPPDAVVPRTFEHAHGSITILRDGDEHGAGLVRTCTFEVPKYLLSGGIARSWEVVVDARMDEFARYEAVGKPLWSEATGSHTLEPVDGGAGTILTFREEYHAFGAVSRRVLEGPVHRFIAQRNTATYVDVLGRLGAVARV
jgi:hypothetical protein